VGDVAVAHRVEQISNVIVYGEVEHLPPRFDQSNGLWDQLLPAVPVGMLERIVEDQEGGFVVECDAGKAEPGTEKDLFASPGAEIDNAELVFIAVDDQESANSGFADSRSGCPSSPDTRCTSAVTAIFLSTPSVSGPGGCSWSTTGLNVPWELTLASHADDSGSGLRSG